jgi:DNA-binding GntR family transcriptional regulator
MMNSSKSKKNIVYENLKKRIITHALKQGDPLNESVLSKELKTSKTPIREAMHQLEKDGFVENISGRGFFVSRFSVQDIREIFEIREILECEVVKRAALKSDPETIEAIKKKFETESNGNKNFRDQFKAGDQIHTFIFESFGNNRLLEYYKRLLDHIIRMRLYFFREFHPERSEESFKEHLEIMNALIARDPPRAEKAMRAHLQNSTEYLKKII